MRVIYREDLERVYNILNRAGCRPLDNYAEAKALLGRLIDESMPEDGYANVVNERNVLTLEVVDMRDRIEELESANSALKKGLSENERKIKNIRHEEDFAVVEHERIRHAFRSLVSSLSEIAGIEWRISRSNQENAARVINALNKIKQERDLYANMAADADVLREKLSEAERAYRESDDQQVAEIGELQSQLAGLQRAYDDLAKTKDYAEVDVMALVKRVDRLEAFVRVPAYWAARD